MAADEIFFKPLFTFQVSSCIVLYSLECIPKKTAHFDSAMFSNKMAIISLDLAVGVSTNKHKSIVFDSVQNYYD